MGKSSSKKVARAARAGGRSPGARQRNLLFPAVLAFIFLGGSGLVTFAAIDRKGDATVPPVVGDHWHSAYGIYVCDEYRPAVETFENPSGIHTHGDGLFHIHPFTDGNAGESATIGAFLETPGIELSDDELRIPENVLQGGNEELVISEEEDDCDGEDAELMVAHWETAQSEENPALFRTDLDGIRFRADGEVFAIAFVPEDTTEIPMPESVGTLNQVTGALQAPEQGGDQSTTTTPGEGQGGQSTTTTAPGDQSSDTTDTTAGGGGG
jgi:hypothetical protein